jgi:glycosyltransferase involved in cell wall biosynthesis
MDYDFGYPLEVSSSVYRAPEMLELFCQIQFKNPNTWEEAMSQRSKNYSQSHPVLGCWEVSGAFSIPVNIVQNVCDNRAGDKADYSAGALAAAFAEGKRIQTQALDNFVPNGCHQEVELKIAPEKEPVPVVSVIMPCYKQAHYLKEAVASVVAQTFSDWELIIVNDGSPDDTNTVAHRLIAENPQRRIRLLEKKNGGLAHARNAGIRAANGAYILPLDSDDKIDPIMLEKTVALLDSRPDIAVAYTNITHFGAVDRTLEAADFDFKAICIENQLNYCSLYRRELWEWAGGYKSNMIWGYEDWDFWVTCGELGLKPQRIPLALLLYRIKDSSMLAEARAHDAELRARLVLNHPAQYDAKKVADARAIWGNPALPSPPNAPKVSVIVPAYNRPARLEETLRSITAQTLKDVEIIVVNDAGVDVEHVVNRCRGGMEIVYVRHRANRERSATRNTGLRLARGRYIAFLDDDDIFLPDHLETLVNFLEGTGHKAAYTDAFCAEEEKTPDGKFRVVNRRVAYSDDWDNEGILRQNSVPVLCFLHERLLGIATGDFDERLNSHEDWDYWIRLSRLAVPEHIKKTTCEYRVPAGGPVKTRQRLEDYLGSTRMIYKKHAVLSADKTTRARQKRVVEKLEQELAACGGPSAGPGLGGFLRKIFGS